MPDKRPSHKGLAGVTIENPLSPVKSFSILKRAIYGLLPTYGGWFLANLYLETSIASSAKSAAASPRLMSWFILGTGLLTALFLCLAPPAGKGRALSKFFRIFSRFGGFLRPLLLGFLLILLALHARVCLLERVKIQGRSMEPALTEGGRIWIEKASLGLNLPRLDFPFGPLSLTYKLPAFGWKLPERGDVVVFRYPGAGKRYFIKRVIGLPGDRFEFKEDSVFINDRRLRESYLKPSTRTSPHPEVMSVPPNRLRPEFSLLSPLVRYSAMNGCGERGRVPPGSLLVLGDNRRISLDSRALGFIPVFYLEGRALGLGSGTKSSSRQPYDLRK